MSMTFKPGANCEYCQQELTQDIAAFDTEFGGYFVYECENPDCDGEDTIKCEDCGETRHDGHKVFLLDENGEYWCVSCSLSAHQVGNVGMGIGDDYQQGLELVEVAYAS